MKAPILSSLLLLTLATSASAGQVIENAHDSYKVTLSGQATELKRYKQGDTTIHGYQCFTGDGGLQMVMTAKNSTFNSAEANKKDGYVSLLKMVMSGFVEGLSEELGGKSIKPKGVRESKLGGYLAVQQTVDLPNYSITALAGKRGETVYMLITISGDAKRSESTMDQLKATFRYL